MKKLLKKGYLVYTCLECGDRHLTENHIKETGHHSKVEMEWQLKNMTNEDIKVWRNIVHKYK